MVHMCTMWQLLIPYGLEFKGAWYKFALRSWKIELDMKTKYCTSSVHKTCLIGWHSFTLDATRQKINGLSKSAVYVVLSTLFALHIFLRTVYDVEIDGAFQYLPTWTVLLFDDHPHPCISLKPLNSFTIAEGNRLFKLVKSVAEGSRCTVLAMKPLYRPFK